MLKNQCRVTLYINSECRHLHVSLAQVRPFEGKLAVKNQQWFLYHEMQRLTAHPGSIAE